MFGNGMNESRLQTYTPPRSRVAARAQAPLIAHILFRLDVGGLENGVVNLLNHMPRGRFRHAIICLSDFTDFRLRIQNREEVGLFALQKRRGKDPAVYFRLWRLLRRLRPDIVHTRNIGALDCAFIAALAGVPHRVHGEHGWDVDDLHGESRKYQTLRRVLRPLIDRYVVVSHDLDRWLTHSVRIPRQQVSSIINGVDTKAFCPATDGRTALIEAAGPAFAGDAFVIGTVGRMQPVKDQLTLARAFIQLVHAQPQLRARLRLVMLGDGPLRSEVAGLLQREGLHDSAWLPGARDDIAALLHGFDVFALPSLNEGISNTVLEAMASGLPVVATAVGGNPELIVDNDTGRLVPPNDPAALAAALAGYAKAPALAAAHGRAGRARVERNFGLQQMVTAYTDLYDGLLK